MNILERLNITALVFADGGSEIGKYCVLSSEQNNPVSWVPGFYYNFPVILIDEDGFPRTVSAGALDFIRTRDPDMMPLFRVWGSELEFYFTPVIDPETGVLIKREIWLTAQWEPKNVKFQQAVDASKRKLFLRTGQRITLLAYCCLPEEMRLKEVVHE